MGWVVHIAVRPELGLDVLVSQDPHLGGQVLSMGTQDAAIKWDRREECHGLGVEAMLPGWGGQPHERGAHV